MAFPRRGEKAKALQRADKVSGGFGDAPFPGALEEAVQNFVNYGVDKFGGGLLRGDE
jgi:hypothetical protein